MYYKLNWKINQILGKHNPILLITILCLTVLLFVQATTSQNAEVMAKTKLTMDGNSKKAYFALSKIGGPFPCGLEMGIALEDFGRYILSAQSGWLATILPGDTMHSTPQTDGWGGAKLKNPVKEIENMTYQSAYERTKKLLIGAQVHPVNLGGEEFTAFDHNNMFYEGLISTQHLIKKTEEQAALIDDLIERIKRLEKDNYPENAVGKIAISPNPSGDNYLNVNYTLYEDIRYASLTINDMQGKQLYKVCYLNNNSFQSTAQKLIIQ